MLSEVFKFRKSCLRVGFCLFLFCWVLFVCLYLILFHNIFPVERRVVFLLLSYLFLVWLLLSDTDTWVRKLLLRPRLKQWNTREYTKPASSRQEPSQFLSFPVVATGNGRAFGIHPHFSSSYLYVSASFSSSCSPFLAPISLSMHIFSRKTWDIIIDIIFFYILLI